MLRIGQQRAKKRRAEQQAGDQLAHNGRLAQPHHGFAEQSADQHEHDDLGDEDRVGGPLPPPSAAKAGADRQQATRGTATARSRRIFMRAAAASPRRSDADGQIAADAACVPPVYKRPTTRGIPKVPMDCNCKLFATKIYWH